MISCEQARNFFDAYLNDELSGSLTGELDAHLLECVDCRHQISLMDACGNVLRLDTSEPRMSRDFTDRLLAILQEEPTSRRTLQINRTMAWVGGLVGVAAAIALAVFFYPHSPVHQPNQVAPARYSPASSRPLAELLAGEWSGLPVESLLDASRKFASVAELARLGLDHWVDDVSGQSIVDESEFMLISPAHEEPELDVLDTLPELADDQELM